ncbi:hypothetical protein [Roseibium litorale]|uniref:Uncharacterized protein n=1 Tax=Roseibium litorale TaxID=2803841 RepID=A0ABR9CQC0_9HYPH|nr:hypothetical protein [Roseibium litorale]MBD8893056.1 hypothetical protein [Roseibium litorale]
MMLIDYVNGMINVFFSLHEKIFKSIFHIIFNTLDRNPAKIRQPINCIAKIAWLRTEEPAEISRLSFPQRGFYLSLQACNELSILRGG